ncbi:Protein of unknown function [Mucilaginibacter pineti]|uniref:DUF3667 domain-containing protein n=1 Tax=Mucilaginibacter pineti TaxID=1391627 RepID=A0A1G6X8P6_9SPHI|nr:DUF3667 domain-containing protein [Mucilaginibacter pineti]SDD74472.1 Protein of unknown function [Mucilaginibacter pineti]
MVNGNFCCNCGLPVQIKRVDWHYVLHEIQHVLHFDKGILYTVKELLIRPGQNINVFIADNRSRLIKPILFIIITSFTYTIIDHFFHIEQGYLDYRETKKTTLSIIFNWVQNHYGYANIIMGTFIAFWLKLFFNRYSYNFFEILILLCFVMGMGMLIFSVFAIIQGITHFNLMSVAGIIGFGYCTWAIGQFFDKKKTVNFIKASASYILGMITFMVTAILLGTSIDLIIKH